MERKFWYVRNNISEWETVVEYQPTNRDFDFEDGEEGLIIEPCPNPSGELLARWMDNNAGADNHHVLNGTHTLVYTMISEKVGEDAATEIFQAWAETHDYFHRQSK